MAGSASQSPKPAWQVRTQRRAAQLASEFWPAVHALRHAPQCASDVSRSTSQPLVTSPSQSARPDAHMV
ncbi:MAG: hypothetical protein IPN17_32085 [Deltaproteobacteria bacterium]|nr:hypothetical protein [Deltaproteobacteria bacterium]